MEGEAAHEPVLREKVVELLRPQRCSVILDCTVGLGGHAEALLTAAADDTRFVGIDLDEENLRRARDRLSRFSHRVRLFRASFDQVGTVLAETDEEQVDALLADLGVCSAQIDDPARGFSYTADGPLDMRMDRCGGETAADLVNRLDEKSLADLIYTCGEERYSRRIARAIVAARRKERIERTLQLAGIVAGSLPKPVAAGRRGIHPAARTFQALRIAVNDELGALDRLLEQLPDVLSVGGRAAVISFHSLEDRRVKRSFAESAESGRARLLTKKPLSPDAEEVEKNPRCRSAKLRGIERIA
ncbi:MAG: 16S rRNA (cytosine(1402)-N(4))-methyltransferase RsmH [Phycisphaerae bacterium]